MPTPAAWLKGLAKEHNVNLTEVLNSALVEIFGLQYMPLGDYKPPYIGKDKTVENFSRNE